VSAPPAWELRAAAPGDEAQLWALVSGLAAYEHLEHELEGGPEALAADLFGPSPRASVLVADAGGTLLGYAMYFPTYDSFAPGTRGIWLTDLFVSPAHRGAGLGRALLAGVARLTVDRGACRLEWDVLTWNTPALAFYRRAGAVPTPGWARQRLAGEALAALAARAARAASGPTPPG
jgi:GNAT superfamily N-acetyltransferase